MIQATQSMAGKEEVKRLLAAATRTGRPDKYAGKRKKTRLRNDNWMDLRRDLATETTTQVSTHDISLGGVSFWIRKQVELGDTVYLRDGSDTKPHPWIKVRVTHCVTGLKGFLVGGEFQFD